MKIYRNEKLWIHANKLVEKSDRHIRFGTGFGASKLGRMRDYYIDFNFYKYRTRFSVSICFPNKILK